MKRQLSTAERERAEDLQVQRVTLGLSGAEWDELEQLDDPDDPSYDLAAAALELAMLRHEPMPAHVASAISNALPVPGVPATLAGVAVTLPSTPVPTGSSTKAIAVVPMVDVVTAPPQPYQPPHQPPPQHPVDQLAAARAKRMSSSARIAMVASITLGLGAAAAAALYVSTRTPETKTRIEYRDRLVEAPQAPKPPTPAEARQQLLKSPDAKTFAWTATPDPAAKGVTGDVVWSAAEQKGYMRFVGLAINDVKQLQYQLWIFDKDRDDKYPVDGGVFDITASGEVIVPIAAKLDVNQVALFAVTVEAPGGVVVSKREHIVVTAAPSKTG